MTRLRARLRSPVLLFLAVNVAGLIWIQRSVTTAARGGIRIVSALPARDVDLADRFAIVLDEPLVEPKAVGEALERSPFVIDPQPDGYWTWAAPDRLEYRLREPLAAGRVYCIRAAADFEAQTGRRLVGDKEFRFKTRSLSLVSCVADVADPTHANFLLRFNQAVNPANLLTHVDVSWSDSSSRLEPVCLTRESSETLVLRVERSASNRLKVVVDAGLVGAGGELPLGESVTRYLDVDPVFSLESASASCPTFEKESKATLDFTRRLDQQQAIPKVVLNPPVKGLKARIWWDELRLRGPFQCGQRYTATVGPNLLAEDGTPLGENQTISFEIPDRSPGIRFPLNHGILNPNGNLILGIEVVNVTGVQFSVSRVLANNLVTHLRGTGARATSREVLSRTITLDLPRNTPKNAVLDLGEMLGRPLGVYRIDAEATDQTWTDDSAIVNVTDLAITCKRERDGVFAWVTSLSTGRPVFAAKVTAVSYNNQILASAVTNADGTVRLVVPDNHPDGAPWVIIAEQGDDVSFLRPDERPWVIDGVDQSGRDTPSTYDVMLYAERGVYRPGDTIHVTGIIRDVSGDVPPSFPLSIVVRRPDGRQVAVLTAETNTNAQGVFQVDYPTREDGQLGRYEFTAGLSGSNDALGSTDVLVEAFAPVRIELAAEPTSQRFGPGQKPQLSVSAQYLFGKPAAAVPVTATGRYCQVAFVSTRYPDYSFLIPGQAQTKPMPDVLGALDAEGRLNVELSPPPSEPAGLWRGDVAVTVTEPGSRSVSKNLVVLADTADRHIGLHIAAGRLVPTETPIRLDWVQLTGADTLAEPGAMTFRLDRVEHDSTLQKVNDQYVWKSVERLIPVLKPRTVNKSDPAAQGALDVTCPTGGLHRFVAKDEISGGRTILEFYAAADDAEAQLLAMNHPERLELVLDKAQYAPGDTAKLLVRSPIPGTMLLTMETDCVVFRDVLQLDANSLTIDVPVPANLRGGAFLTATVVRAIDPTQDKWLPHRAMGMARLSIDHRQHVMDLKIDCPSQSRPGETLEVAVQTDVPNDPDRPAVVHLWAVDEGILLTTAYETPDPCKYIFAPRAGVVETSDLFADLLPDHKRPVTMERIGAGEDFEKMGESALRLRRSPVPTRRREAAIVWRAAATVGPDGRFIANMAMPNLTGRMRLMAVAVDQDRYGSAEQGVTLAAPLMVEAGWPRFAAPGDEFQAPVKLFNTTDDSLTVALELKVEGPLTIAYETDFANITAPPDAPALVWLTAKATSVGPVTVRATATAHTSSADADGLTASTDAEFSIRPAAPLHSESRLHRIKAGESLTIDPPVGFMPGSVHTNIQISARPDVELLPAIEALVGYPYGCVEQTTSRLYAMLHAGDVFTRELPADVRMKRVNTLIDAGIVRLWSMQTRSGGLAYWPGDQHANAWGSAYAASFLVEAKSAGHPVNAGFVKGLVAYLESSLNRNAGDDLDDNMKSLICYVLAAFDRPQNGWMARLGERLDRLDMEGRAFLAKAWLALGRKDRAAAILTPDTIEKIAATTTSGRITSRVRQEAVLLIALLDLAPESPWIPTLVRDLESARKDAVWGNTLENATALAALARYQAASQGDCRFRGEFVQGDRTLLSFDHLAPASCEIEESSTPMQIVTAGVGDVYVTVRHQGLLSDGASLTYDRRLCVRRRWLNARGAPVDPAELHVGELVRVEISLSAPGLDTDESVANVAIVDALPGGLEVENPRLAGSVPLEHGSYDIEPDRVEFLDDRVIVFTSARSQPRTFSYGLRVITAGSFTVPPIEASCMYDSDYASLNGCGRVEIKP